MGSVERCELPQHFHPLKQESRAAVADKPRDAFVQRNDVTNLLNTSLKIYSPNNAHTHKLRVWYVKGIQLPLPDIVTLIPRTESLDKPLLTIVTSMRSLRHNV